MRQCPLIYCSAIPAGNLSAAHKAAVYDGQVCPGK